MRVSVVAIGRMKRGAETELAADYAARFGKAAGAVGLQWGGVREFAESRAQTAELRKRQEAEQIKAALKPASLLVLLDERGKALPSRAFAAQMGQWRDSGRQEAVFALGGPDGFAESLRTDAELLLAFGAMTWPHRLARIMLAEQLCRAALILAGHPYHRD